jgi:hypothetical protein
MFVCVHDVGEADWADCIDKAVLLCCRSMFLVDRKEQFQWYAAQRVYGWSDFLNIDGTPQHYNSKLRQNRIRNAAQTRGSYVPGASRKNFRYFDLSGRLRDRNPYSWAAYKSAGAPIGVGDSSAVLQHTPDHARDPWSIPLLPGDVMVFDLRWHGEGGYSGHVPTVAYVNAVAGHLAVVEDHLPRGVGAAQVPSESDAFLYTRSGEWDYVPGLNPAGGTNLCRGVGRFGRGGIFGDPHSPLAGEAFEPTSGRLVATRDFEAEGRGGLMGRNYAGFLGFARFACRM